MGACLLITALLGLTAGLAAAAPVSWGSAIEVPGSEALNAGHDAHVIAVSCASTGNCVAGGIYNDGGYQEAFVAAEVNGLWQSAIQAPGTESSTYAKVNAASCAPGGDCTIVGVYNDVNGYYQPLILREHNGVWSPQTFSGSGGVSGAFVNPIVTAISCRGAGNCSAGGTYYENGGQLQVFVADEKNGVWGPPNPIPGLNAANMNYADLTSLSCSSGGNCSAGGAYYDSVGRQAFVASEKGGVWQKFVKVAGVPTLNAGHNAQTNAVSCGANGYCSAGGFYADANGYQHAWVAIELAGVWKKGVRVPGTPTVDTYGSDLTSLSCKGTQRCSAGGWYTDANGARQAYVADEKYQAWGKQHTLTGFIGYAQVNSISCASAGNCAAVGEFSDSSGLQAFVVKETNGVWNDGGAVPGSTALNAGSGAVANSVSCATATFGSGCAIGGYYTDGNGYIQAFVTQP